MSEQHYGDRFEGAVIFAMITLIVLSIVGVIALQSAHHKECSASDYTYCGEPAGH